MSLSVDEPDRGSLFWGKQGSGEKAAAEVGSRGYFGRNADRHEKFSVPDDEPSFCAEANSERIWSNQAIDCDVFRLH